MKQPVYLIVQFNWPRPFKPEYGALAKELHKTLQGQDWIEEVLAASGGIGTGPASVWIFKLPEYAALDRLLHDEGDSVVLAYQAFFTEMVDVEDVIREQVLFT